MVGDMVLEDDENWEHYIITLQSYNVVLSQVYNVVLSQVWATCSLLDYEM